MPRQYRRYERRQSRRSPRHLTHPPLSAIVLLINEEIKDIGKELAQMQISGVYDYEEEQRFLQDEIEHIKKLSAKKNVDMTKLEYLEDSIEVIRRRANRLIELAKDERTVTAKRMLDDTQSTIWEYAPPGGCKDDWVRLFEEVKTDAKPTFQRLEREGGYSSDDKEAQQVYAKINNFHTLTNELKGETSPAKTVELYVYTLKSLGKAHQAIRRLLDLRPRLQAVPDDDEEKPLLLSDIEVMLNALSGKSIDAAQLNFHSISDVSRKAKELAEIFEKEIEEYCRTSRMQLDIVDDSTEKQKVVSEIEALCGKSNLRLDYETQKRLGSACLRAKQLFYETEEAIKEELARTKMPIGLEKQRHRLLSELQGIKSYKFRKSRLGRLERNLRALQKAKQLIEKGEAYHTVDPMNKSRRTERFQRQRDITKL